MEQYRMRMQIRFVFLALTAALFLSACGFQLRGSGAGSTLPFKTLFIEARGVGNDMKRQLSRSTTTKIVEDRKEAEAIVEIMNDVRDRQILSLNSAGRVREYALFQRVTFRVIDNQKRELSPPTLVMVQRTLSFNESQVLAKEGEEASLYQDMQYDMANQLLRRIAATKPWDPARNTR